ncbi:MAG: hypothetical protein WCQ95_14450 [Bacteroidota bacterium]
MKKIVLLFLLITFYAKGHTQNNNNSIETNAIQKELGFEIVFGVYNDDSYNHTFDAKERKWILKKGILIYKIDANDVAYADTIALKKNDIKTIINFVNEQNLFISINKDLSKGLLNKFGHTETITAQITYQNQKANFNLKTNSPSSFYEDVDANRLKKLEDLLYQIVETYKE